MILEGLYIALWHGLGIGPQHDRRIVAMTSRNLVRWHASVSICVIAVSFKSAFGFLFLIQCSDRPER